MKWDHAPILAGRLSRQNQSSLSKIEPWANLRDALERI
jgi:hypothetical protein